MNNHNESQGVAPEVPPPLPSQRPGAGPSVVGATPAFDSKQPAADRSLHASAESPLPEGIRGWCWGAFLLNWVWAIRFRVWWGLLSLVPLVGLLVPIWLGIKGRELAWRRGAWTGVEAFNQAQRKWSIAGFVLTILACLAYGGNYLYERHEAQAVSSATEEEFKKILAEPVTVQAPAPDPKPQAAPPVQGSINVGDTMPNRIDTANGTLERRELPDHSSAIFLGDQRLYSGDDANWQELVRKFVRSDGSEAVLLRSAGGRGNSCEALYFFVVVYRSGIRYSPEFGSCTPAIDYEQRGDVITLTMPRMGGVSVYQFGNDDQVLGDGKPVSMTDSVNPSK